MTTSPAFYGLGARRNHRTESVLVARSPTNATARVSECGLLPHQPASVDTQDVRSMMGSSSPNSLALARSWRDLLSRAGSRRAQCLVPRASRHRRRPRHRGPPDQWSWTVQGGPLVFAPFETETDYWVADKQFMLNLRVRDLDSLLEQLDASGIAEIVKPEWTRPRSGVSRGYTIPRAMRSNCRSRRRRRLRTEDCPVQGDGPAMTCVRDFARACGAARTTADPMSSVRSERRRQ